MKTFQQVSDFEWDDGWPYTYTNWQTNEPSTEADETCVVEDANKWKDTACHLTLPFVCKYNFGE